MRVQDAGRSGISNLEEKEFTLEEINQMAAEKASPEENKAFY